MNPIIRTLFRNKETGKTDSKIYNVIEDVVTLNPNYIAKHYYGKLPSTVFREIEVIPYTEAVSPELLTATRHPQDTPMKEPEFFKGILETLKRYIEEKWDTDKHHLVQHSSGFDSRIMSTLIRQIYTERGDDWLGDISFVAWGHEIDLAEKIVRFEGWKHEPFHGLPKDEEYFKRGLDFGYAWKGLNGSAGYPINNPDWAFRLLQSRDVIPRDTSNIQVWAASFFNEVFKTKIDKANFETNLIEHYYNCENAKYGAAFEFDFIQPLLNPATIEHIVRAKVHLPGHPTQVRGRLVEYLDRDIARFPRLDHQTITVPQNYYSQTISDYKHSYYGKTRPTSPIRDIKYHPWWAAWSTASFVEHLIEDGVEIIG